MKHYRLAVLADPHGNGAALEAVLTDLQPLALDGLLCAGDYIGGPDDADVLAWLQARGAWLVRGNGEDYIARIERGAAPPEWNTLPRNQAPPPQIRAVVLSGALLLNTVVCSGEGRGDEAFP